LALGALVLSIGGLASPGAVGTAANFQDDDGDLAPTATVADWNSFAPLTWTGSAPYREATKTPSSGLVNGWVFNGKEDDQASNTDTGYAGGTKQDKDCATISG